MAPKKAHADLGASSAHRWMACPGSVALSAGLPDRPSEYAREGTAAHSLLERSLRKHLDPSTWLDTEIKIKDSDGEHHILVTEEMCDAVQVAVNEVWRRVDHHDAVLLIEHKFDLSGLNPPGPMFGTSDVVIWVPFAKRLTVLDYKHGAGVAVDATENEQLLYYGLGSVIELNVVPEEIEVVIVQPRAHHPDGIVRSFHTNFETLKHFKGELLGAAERTIQPDAPLVVGDHCRFCKAIAVCPAQRQHAIEIAQTEFDVVEEPGLPGPELLTDEQISRVLAAGPVLEEWLRAIKQFITNKLERGEAVPGWKLVPKRSSRKWKEDEDSVAGTLAALGLAESDRYVSKLVSPAQAEAALKKIKQKLPEEFVLKVSSGYNLAPASDPRPALALSPADDFEAE